MKDIMDELTAVHREVGAGKVPAGEGRTVLLRRTYLAEVDDVWDALTNPERIPRWFLPISGDLALGGRYQLEGNAGGEILRCDAPHLIKVTWVFGDGPADASEVEVRLAPGEAGQTVLELEHTAVVDPGMWDQFGPGAVGVGWDLTVLGLSLYLDSAAGVSIEDKEAWAVSDEAKRFMTASAQAWGGAHEASGASSETAAAGVVATIGFYVPPVE